MTGCAFLGWRGTAMAFACALALFWSSPRDAAAQELLVLTAAPVQPGKFAVLDAIAQPQGWRVRHVYAEKLTGEEGAALFKGADLVLLDIPYDPVVAAVERKVGAYLAQAGMPWLKVQDDRHAARGLSESEARTLWRYYQNGGKRNFANFFAYASAVLARAPTADIAPPIVYPEQGVYHPDHEAIFADARAYFAWKQVPAARDAPGRAPVVAFAIHKNYLSADLTAFIDHTVRRIEAAGAVPLVFYSAMADEQGYTRMLAPEGRPVADVVITSQIMLFPQARKDEFERLGLPVIQAMPYRRGDVADWQADPAGVNLMDVPFYLAQPEYAGIVDAMTAAAVRRGDQQVVPIEAQVDAVVNKALRLVALQRTPNADKRVALFFWNYPPGETNLGASYLNLPRSLAASFAAMHAHGYRVETPQAEALIAPMQRLLRPFYREGGFDALLADGLAERLSVARYRAWFDTLPRATREAIVARWGEPENSPMVAGQGADAYFPIPRLALGNVVVLPQPPRGDGEKDKEKALYHDTRVPANHYYLAVYLWARTQFGADAIVHYGTHGTQEWMPGKERGLAASDDALLPIADVPVIYPYIVDDVGEAVQAKRRGRALIVSHQTPPFAPAGLHNEINDLHNLVHEWQSLTEGAVRDKTAEAIVAAAVKLHFDRELDTTPAQALADFPGFLRRLHDWLHELALANQPQGMHTFGTTQDERDRVAMVMQMLGKRFIALVDAEADETFAGDYRQMTQSRPYRWLQQHLSADAPPLAADADPQLGQMLAQARTWYAALDADSEMQAFLDALDGRHVAAGYGGDPIRNPDALPTGRNLYGFDPSKVPTKAAYEAGREAVDKLIAAYRAKHGRAPRKLAFTLWSVETMRHFGVLEAQAFHAMGVRPTWDAGGRINGVELIPRAELGRARIDVVLSATGLYRDHFPNVMRWLAEGAVLAARADEADNAVRANSADVARRLQAQGLQPDEARRWADVRIFSNESGNYGSGIEGAILASDTWTNEDKVARLYLDRLQYAYGADMKDWGRKLPQANLYAEHLKGVDAAALSRSSNLYGMLTTDDPFQYLGGISLAVRHLTGQSPELYIANLRESGNPKAETAAQFLARELRTRQFHPGWIEGLQREGYSGTTEMLDAINNFWGWQVTAPDIVRDDQWQEFADVYVRDKYRLGMRDYFERANPAALAQMIERMLEAVRKDYWQADAATVRELAARYRDLAIRRDVRTDNRAFSEFVERVNAGGYGLRGALPPASAAAAAQAQSRPPSESRSQPPQPQPQTPVPPNPPIRGMQLERIAPPQPPAPVGGLVLAALALTMFAGAWRQQRAPHAIHGFQRSVG